MSVIEIIFISFGLSMDCFAVALSVGACRKMAWKDTLRMALLFGLFQGLMPLAGWLIGNSMHELIESIDHWIAFGILSLIGSKMIWQALQKDHENESGDIRKLSVLLPLSVATSIDALITGIGFGFIRVNILLAVILITVITFLVSVTGAKLGEKTTFIPAKWAELFGGIVLIAIGIKVLIEHTM